MLRFPQKLLHGYGEFMRCQHSVAAARYAELATAGQKPQTMVIACCDSRAAPETIFNAGPGELFVARNVANLVSPYQPDAALHATSAALEFAVQALKVKDIVVLGHGRCGGIAAALQPNSTPLSPDDFIGNWMRMLQPLAKQIQASTAMTAKQRQTALERISIRNSVTNLLTFPCVKILSERGKLRLHGAWFDIFSGEIWVMDADSGDFQRPQSAVKTP